LTNRASSFATFSTVILLLTAILSNGCGVYNNLTTYFNTFYNAQHLFADAVDEMNRSPQKDRDTNYFASYLVPQGSATKFDSVIVKCSKIIQYHADTKYVSEAIFMIGQCYYYQKENESAIKKFQELISNFPKDDNVIPAKLWFAKTEYLDRKPDAAMTIVDALIPETHEAGKSDIELEAALLKAQIYVDRKEYDLAADEYAKAVDIGGDGSLRAMAQFQLASTYEINEKYDQAATAYRDVLKYDADPQLEFKSQYHYGTMLANTGKYTSALNLFNDLKSDRPKNEDLALIDLEIAKTYAMMDDTSKAFDFFRFIDSTYRGTPAYDKSNYERGLLYEYRYKDYKSALSYYSKVMGTGLTLEKASFSKQKAATFTHYFAMLGNLVKCDSMLHPDLYKKAVKDTADSLGGSKTGLKNGERIDSLSISDEVVHLRPNPHEIAVAVDSLLPTTPSVAQNASDTARLIQNVLEKRGDKDSHKQNSEVVIASKDSMQMQQLPIAQKTVPDTVKPAMDEAARKDSSAVKVQDTGKKLAQQSIADSSGSLRKLSDAAMSYDSTEAKEREMAQKAIARRKHDSSFVASDTAGQKFAPPDIANKDVTENLPPEQQALNPTLILPDSLKASGRISQRHELSDDDIVKGRSDKKLIGKIDTVTNVAKLPAPVVITPDSIRRLITKTEFELAGVFYLELHMPDSAAALYQKIIQDTNGTRYIPGSLYALAELYRTPTDTMATDSLYSVILDRYPKTEYAHKIKRTRGLEDEDSQKNPVDSVFTRVASLIDEKKGMDAIKLLENLVETGDTVTVIPKALYTIGWIYENVLVQNDSAASVYKILLKKYPQSVFALEVNPRVAVREDTTKLSQYVKINEIQSFGKGGSQKKSAKSDAKKKGEGLKDEENNTEPDDEDMQNVRKGNRDVNDDSELDDPEDTTEDNNDINN
jgi:tetratricopeptide (TPR) repeat protein